MVEAGERTLLEQHLAARDEPCPACGYNLRGAIGDKCPECAQTLVLGLRQAGPASALTWFLLLAFGWVFAAGAMNSVRNTRNILSYVDNARMWGFPARNFVYGQTLSPSITLPPRPAPTDGFWTTAWDVVPALSWIGVAWSYTLVVGCGIGLLLLDRRRRHPFAAVGDRRLIRFACVMFSIYAMWHLTNFVMEFV